MRTSSKTLIVSVFLLLPLNACTSASNQVPPVATQVPQVLLGSWKPKHENQALWNGNSTLIFLPDHLLIAVKDGQAIKGRYWIKTDWSH